MQKKKKKDPTRRKGGEKEGGPASEEESDMFGLELHEISESLVEFNFCFNLKIKKIWLIFSEGEEKAHEGIKALWDQQRYNQPSPLFLPRFGVFIRKGRVRFHCECDYHCSPKPETLSDAGVPSFCPPGSCPPHCALRYCHCFSSVCLVLGAHLEHLDRSRCARSTFQELFCQVDLHSAGPESHPVNTHMWSQSVFICSFMQ